MNFVLFYKQQHLIDTWVKIDVGSANDYTLSKLLSWKQYDVKILVKSLGRSSESILRSVFVVGIGEFCLHCLIHWLHIFR